MTFMSRQQGLVTFSDVDSSVIEKLYVFTVSGEKSSTLLWKQN